MEDVTSNSGWNGRAEAARVHHNVSSHERALLALFLAPILGGMLYGFFAMFAIPVMVAIAVVVALPMFFLLRHLQWLQWWFAAIAGALCGLAFAPIYWFTSPPYHVEYIGIKECALICWHRVLGGASFLVDRYFSQPGVSVRFGAGSDKHAVVSADSCRRGLGL